MLACELLLLNRIYTSQALGYLVACANLGASMEPFVMPLLDSAVPIQKQLACALAEEWVFKLIVLILFYFSNNFK